jgi:hypothetical protein
MAPDAEPLAAERDEPWPGGRSNHYLFDLNRDWFPLNHPESQGKVKFLLEWLPQVVVDLHEMGGESQYYFPPAAPPGARHTTQAQRDWMVTFGQANAARFDERGFQYFIREIFDSFYPGYGASWPFFFGSLGKTFEMASSRGLEYRRRDGSTLTFRDGVVRHFTAAIQTAETAARHRERLMRDFIEFRRSAVAEGGTTEYVLLPGQDRPRLERLASLLVMNGIDVRRVEAPLKAGGREVPAGAVIVPLAQPMSRLVRNLLDPHTPMDDEFIAEQNRRRKLRLPDQIYDITAWSLPLLFDIDLVVSEKPTGAKTAPFTSAPRAEAALAPAKVGYLIPWGTGAAAATIDALKAGLTVRATGGAFTQAGRQYGIGTVLVRNEENPAELRQTLGAIAARHGVDAVPLDSAWVDEGLSLGSNTVRMLRLPRVLLAWDAPAQSLSAGWARFTLERRYGQPVTAIRDRDARAAGPHALRRHRPAGRQLRRRARRTRARRGSASGSAAAARSSRSAKRHAGPVSDRVNLLSTYTELRDGRPDRPAGEGRAARRHAARQVRLRRRHHAAPRAPRADDRHHRARDDGHGALAVVGHRRRGAGDGGREPRVRAAHARRRHERRRLRREGPPARERPDVGRGAAAAGAQGVPPAPEARHRQRRRVRRGSELPRLHRADAAAVHERGAVRPGAVAAGRQAAGTQPAAGGRRS